MRGVMEDAHERRGQEFVPLRKYLPHEEYGRAVLLAAAEVNTTLTQLDQTTIFVANFRSTVKLKTHEIDRFDHIVYHLENFLIRITGCLDRCLVLVSTALDLGNEPEDCSYRLIRKNKHVKGSRVLGPLGEINGVIKPYSKQRNAVAHRKRYYEPELRNLEMLSLVRRLEPDVVSEHLVKLEGNRVVAAKKGEMSDTNRRLQAAVSRLFDALEPEVKKHYKRLKHIT